MRSAGVCRVPFCGTELHLPNIEFEPQEPPRRAREPHIEVETFAVEAPRVAPPEIGPKRKVVAYLIATLAAGFAAMFLFALFAPRREMAIPPPIEKKPEQPAKANGDPLGGESTCMATCEDGCMSENDPSQRAICALGCKNMCNVATPGAPSGPP